MSCEILISYRPYNMATTTWGIQNKSMYMYGVLTTTFPYYSVIRVTCSCHTNSHDDDIQLRNCCDTSDQYKECSPGGERKE